MLNKPQLTLSATFKTSSTGGLAKPLTSPLLQSIATPTNVRDILSNVYCMGITVHVLVLVSPKIMLLMPITYNVQCTLSVYNCNRGL